MKISNSKKQLAQIIHENGGWRDGAEWAAQDKQYCGHKNNVALYDSKPPRPAKGEECWGGLSGAMMREFEASELLPNWHQTILSREEYFHLYPAKVEVVVENKTTCNLTVSGEPTIEQLAADYRNAKDYADRKQREADAAKAGAEAKLAELVAAGRALGLVLSVVGVEPEPELVITDWRDLLPGDEIECVDGSWASWATGRIAVVREVESADYAGCMPVMVEVDGDGESDWGDNFKFVRRPAQAQGGTNA